MNKTILFLVLIFTIVISMLGSIVLFKHLGITFKSNSDTVLRRAALVVASNNERETIFFK